LLDLGSVFVGGNIGGGFFADSSRSGLDHQWGGQSIQQVFDLLLGLGVGHVRRPLRRQGEDLDLALHMIEHRQTARKDELVIRQIEVALCG